MNKNPKFEKYAMSVIDKYKSKLLLDRHTFKLSSNIEDSQSFMECVFNYPYLNVQINYGDKIVKKWKDKEDVVPYILHEMCHVITDPFYCKANLRYTSHNEIKDERELLTDYISHIILLNKI